MGMCHAALLNAYTAMFPLDERPHGIFGFAQKFGSYEMAKLLVRRQLVGGAKVALAIHQNSLTADKLLPGCTRSESRSRSAASDDD